MIRTSRREDTVSEWPFWGHQTRLNMDHDRRKEQSMKLRLEEHPLTRNVPTVSYGFLASNPGQRMLADAGGVFHVLPRFFMDFTREPSRPPYRPLSTVSHGFSASNHGAADVGGCWRSVSCSTMLYHAFPWILPAYRRDRFDDLLSRFLMAFGHPIMGRGIWRSGGGVVAECFKFYHASSWILPS